MNEDTFRLHSPRRTDQPLLQSLQQRQDHLLRLAAHRQLGNELRQRGFQPTEIPTVVRDMMVQAMQADGMPAALEVLRRTHRAREAGLRAFPFSGSCRADCSGDEHRPQRQCVGR